MKRAVLVALLAGCGGDGVVVEVDPGAIPVDSIELVLSDRVCKDPILGGKCASVQAPMFGAKLGLEGDLYTREASATLRAVDGVARFELPAEDRRLAMAFAIGRDARGEIVGSAVMADTLDLAAGPIVYRVVLEPTEPLLGSDPAPHALAAQWGADNQCLGVLPHTSTLQPPRPVFILPEDDPDCDTRLAVADGECDALWFDGFAFDPDLPRQCAVPSTRIAGQPCMLGEAPTCMEVGGPVECVESNRCAPDAVCTCGVTDLACQNEKLASPAVKARLDCVFPAQPAVDNPQVSVECAAQDSFLVDPRVVFDVGSNGTCSKAKLILTPNAALTSAVGDQFASGGATFEVVDTQPDCTIQLRWTGTFAGPRAHTVLVVSLDVGGEARELWVPINFEPSLACPLGDVPTCTYVDALPVDGLARCAL